MLLFTDHWANSRSSLYGQKVMPVQLYSCPEMQLYGNDFLPIQTGSAVSSMASWRQQKNTLLIFISLIIFGLYSYTVWYLLGHRFDWENKILQLNYKIHYLEVFKPCFLAFKFSFLQNAKNFLKAPKMLEIGQYVYLQYCMLNFKLSSKLEKKSINSASKKLRPKKKLFKMWEFLTQFFE